MTQTTTTTHTAAQLAALAPRELDALAHVTVIRQRVVDLRQSDNAIVSLYEIDNKAVPHYSISLDAAALLERELARRGHDVRRKYTTHLIPLLDNYRDAFDMTTASAKDRTIAAILAVQDSPYVQIVTWDKHPKDAANSQSASEPPAA